MYNTADKYHLLTAYHIYQQYHSGDEHRQVITGLNEVPVEVHRGMVINHTGLKTSQEEADVIVIHLLCELIANNPQCITVVCDDPDVFLLLVHHNAFQQMTCTVIMEGISVGRTVVDIPGTAKKHAAIVSQLLQYTPLLAVTQWHNYLE